MFYKKNENFGMSYIAAAGVVAALMFWLTVAAFGQTNPTMPSPMTKPAVQTTEKKPEPLPVLTDYKGIKIGMTSKEVRDTLDTKPKVADKTGFYYVFSDGESAQIALDKNKKVRVISAMYSGKNANAPKVEDVFGNDVSVTSMKNGRVYKLVSYPEAGYWIAYNRSTGNNPTVTVTMQKMRQAK